MKLIAGLGNPGCAYEATRHNIGFRVIDELSDRLGIELAESKFNGVFGRGAVGDEKVMLVKPLTYMNASGECIVPLLDYFGIEDEELLIVYDDLDLAPGKLRLRQKGSAGGHNGMKSVIAHLGSESFNRMKLGIGRPPGYTKVTDYVLSPFAPEERPAIDDLVTRAADACESWLTQPFLSVMNEYNIK